MNADFTATACLFDENAAAVERLLDFDKLIIEVAVDGLKQLVQELDDRNLHSAVTLVRNRASLLSNVKDSESLRPQYEAMFNQCVVLLVSYFGSAAHTMFRQGVAVALASGADVPAAKEELKVSWRGVAQAEEERETMFANLLIAQHGVSFQDMQSIARAFKSHLDVELPRSSDTNNIILGQAARHVIVHAASLVDGRMARQVAGAKPRTLKDVIVEGRPIRFSTREVRTLSASMTNYVAEMSASLTLAQSKWLSRDSV